MTSKPLTYRRQLFVAELLADSRMNQTDAAIKVGFSPKTAAITASKLMADPRVIEALKARGAERF